MTRTGVSTDQLKLQLHSQYAPPVDRLAKGSSLSGLSKTRDKLIQTPNHPAATRAAGCRATLVQRLSGSSGSYAAWGTCKMSRSSRPILWNQSRLGIAVGTDGTDGTVTVLCRLWRCFQDSMAMGCTLRLRSVERSLEKAHCRQPGGGQRLTSPHHLSFGRSQQRPGCRGLKQGSQSGFMRWEETHKAVAMTPFSTSSSTPTTAAAAEGLRGLGGGGGVTGVEITSRLVGVTCVQPRRSVCWVLGSIRNGTVHVKGSTTLTTREGVAFKAGSVLGPEQNPAVDGTLQLDGSPLCSPGNRKVASSVPSFQASCEALINPSRQGPHGVNQGYNPGKHIDRHMVDPRESVWVEKVFDHASLGRTKEDLSIAAVREDSCCVGIDTGHAPERKKLRKGHRSWTAGGVGHEGRSSIHGCCVGIDTGHAPERKKLRKGHRSWTAGGVGHEGRSSIHGSIRQTLQKYGQGGSGLGGHGHDDSDGDGKGRGSKIPINRLSLKIDHDRSILVETGDIGRQASGAVTVREGETVLYATACVSKEPQKSSKAAPLNVSYQERFSAVGKTVAGLIKREGRVRDHEVLTSRLIDRSIRPLMPEGFSHETQILTWVLSYDGRHSPAPLAITAAGAALAISAIPISKPLAGVRVGMTADRSRLIVNPTADEMATSELDLVVAGTSNAVLMIEGYCNFLTDEEVLNAVETGYGAVSSICRQLQLWAEEVRTPKMMVTAPASRGSHEATGKDSPTTLEDLVMSVAGDELTQALFAKGPKKERNAAVKQVEEKFAQRIMSLLQGKERGGGGRKGGAKLRRQSRRSKGGERPDHPAELRQPFKQQRAKSRHRKQKVKKAGTFANSEHNHDRCNNSKEEENGGKRKHKRKKKRKRTSGYKGEKEGQHSEKTQSANGRLTSQQGLGSSPTSTSTKNEGVGWRGVEACGPKGPQSQLDMEAAGKGECNTSGDICQDSGSDTARRRRKRKRRGGRRRSPPQSSSSSSSRKSDCRTLEEESGVGSSSSSCSRQDVKKAFKTISSRILRSSIVNDGTRCDGRGPKDVRPISCRCSLLPRTHGSALFTRGETQALAVATLGGEDVVERVHTINGEERRRFYLQYFFPPSCVGEAGRVGPPGRREIGHGALAQRALDPIIPSYQDFPYAMRLESMITESNGSSSMASVCAGCLALLDAGVPIRKMVAGVAMGLILGPGKRKGSPDKPLILTDILGIEDALGDMDFKVAGDENGVTAFQMDIKVEGITIHVMRLALMQAREARCAVLEQMRNMCNPPPRKSLSRYAPHIGVMTIDPSKVAAVIGPGGKTVKRIIALCDVESIDVEGDGSVRIVSSTEAALQHAKEEIRRLVCL
ncbi:hypothetical protein CBR_g30163 [Chara braunii]|uniref:polyribonucleotide nucleotidyltransferase n=1 Tax=Chara braunii TaxID=69332 RepID=A0A388LC68_CHABU|nr:hypothetical protein CBR_g30163 [Chara braunii]|eukprot:GBG79898.1 hypothetical protein CBR_g30163 [Chara braunii]